MRIAVSGTHRTGKTSLVQALINELPEFVGVDEPYWRMVEEGFEFNHPPSLSDFEAQLEYSLGALKGNEDNILFDRCPVDILAYILSHEDAGMFTTDPWLPRINAALGSLDLVFHLPIETQDRIRLSESHESDDGRLLVDDKLRELLLDDVFDFNLRVISVKGGLNERLGIVGRAICAVGAEDTLGADRDDKERNPQDS